MEEADRQAAEVIARNVGLLESAIDFASTKMDAALFDAVRETLRRKNEHLRWESEFGDNFDDGPWMAPTEWRADGEDVGRDYHLYCHLCIDDDEMKTWLAYFAGVEGRRAYLCISTSTITGSRNLRNFARGVQNELDQLIDVGFIFDSKGFKIKWPMNFDQEQIAKGFVDDDLAQALGPLEDAIDRVANSREVLDRIQDAIRRETA